MSVKAVIYARQSTKGQSEYSLAMQLKELREYAISNNYQIVGEYEEYYTGTESERPELSKIRDGDEKFDLLLVYSVDRLARDEWDLGIFIKYILKKGGSKTYFLKEGFEADLSDEYITFRIFMEGIAARRYIEKMKEQMARGKRGRAYSGKVLVGDMPPYGYEYNPESGQLAIIESEARIVRSIFRWYLEGDESGKKLGMIKIATKLTQMGIPTKSDAKRRKRLKKNDGVWNQSTVRRILTGEVYYGIWYFNRRDTRGNKTVMRPRSEWIAVEVDPIVTKDDFEAARTQAKQNLTRSPRNTKREYLLQHRLTCPKCNMMFRGQPGKGGYSYYLCGGQKIENSIDGHTKLCHRVISVKRWDSLIWEAIKDLLLNPELIFEGIRHNQEKSKNEMEAIREYLSACEASLADIESEEWELLNSYVSKRWTKNMIDKKMEELSKKKEALSAKKMDYERRIAKSVGSEDHIRIIKERCEQARVGIENFTFEDKRAVLDMLNIEGMVYRGENAKEDYMVLTGFLPLSEDGKYSLTVTTSKYCNSNRVIPFSLTVKIA